MRTMPLPASPRQMRSSGSNPDAFSSVVDPFTRKCVPAWSDFKAAIANEANNSCFAKMGIWHATSSGRRASTGAISLLLVGSESASGQALRWTPNFYNFLNHPNLGNPSYFSAFRGGLRLLLAWERLLPQRHLQPDFWVEQTRQTYLQF